MLTTRPLYDNRADARYFVEPVEWTKLRNAASRGLNVLLQGSRGSGKTTLLRHLQMVMRDENQPATFVDATACDGLVDLVARICDAVAPDYEARSSAVQERAPGASTGSAEWVQLRLDEIGGGSPQMLIVDGSSSGSALYELFGRMRDTLWQQPHSWLVSVDADDAPTVSRPPADAFFDLVLKIEGMGEAALEEVLARRSPETPKSELRAVVRGSQGHPRRAIQTLARALLDGSDPQDSIAERNILVGEAGQLGRPYAMLMSELIDRGHASPSDDDLQRSLGITRGRLTAYLRELLDAGLVAAEPEKRDRPGRPRMLYTPRSRAQ